MPKLNQRTLKQRLKSLSHEELLDEIGVLFDKFTKVKEYYEIKLGAGDNQQVLEKYKAIIKNEFNPPRGLPKARLSVAKKAISDFKKLSNSPVDLADLMLSYVEAGVGFTLEFGDIDEPFYNSMESMYEKAVKHIFAHRLQNQFEWRCRKIVTDTSGMGWGFPDALGDIYDEHFRTSYGAA
ncbi:MAG: DUF6155 family protein [Blastocatellales bacterium]